MMVSDDVQVMSIRLPKELYERLRRRSFDSRESMNAIITRGVEHELETGSDGEGNA